MNQILNFLTRADFDRVLNAAGLMLMADQLVLIVTRAEVEERRDA